MVWGIDEGGERNQRARASGEHMAAACHQEKEHIAIGDGKEKLKFKKDPAR